MSKFVLGPLQEMWLTSLEQHPERQGKGRLGIGTPENYIACCLGEFAIVCSKQLDINVEFKDGFLEVGGALLYLNDYERYGLRNHGGIIKNGYRAFSSLSVVNDSGKTWPEIAAFIRANPESVFTHSV